MSSIPSIGPSTSAGRVSLADDVSEGIRLCEFVIRMRLRNRMVVDSLTGTDLADPIKGWLKFARKETRRLAEESQAGAKRAADLRDFTAKRRGSGQSPHDYRAQDTVHLDRRAHAGRRVGRRLRRQVRSRHFLGVLLAIAAQDALDEVRRAVKTQQLAPADLLLVEARMDHLVDLASSVPMDTRAP